MDNIIPIKFMCNADVHSAIKSMNTPFSGCFCFLPTNLPAINSQSICLNDFIVVLLVSKCLSLGLKHRPAMTWHGLVRKHSVYVVREDASSA